MIATLFVSFDLKVAQMSNNHFGTPFVALALSMPEIFNLEGRYPLLANTTIWSVFYANTQ